MAKPHGALGNRLEQTRRALGFPTQKEFCDALKIDKSDWNHFETGTRRITLPLSIKIKQKFGVTLDWIYCADPSGLPMRIAEKLNRLAA